MRRFSSRWVWAEIKRVLLVIYGLLIRVRVVGKERLMVPLRSGFIVAANHLTGADSIVIQVALKTRVFFLAAARWFHSRFVGFWMRNLCDTMPVATGGAWENVKGLRQGMELLQQGAVVGIYPEGELNRSGEIRRVYDGAAWLAVRSKRPLVPVYVSGLKLGPAPGSRPWIDEAWEGFFSVVGNLLNRNIVVAIGEPIVPPATPPQTPAEMAAVIEQINRQLLAEFQRLRVVSVDHRRN